MNHFDFASRNLTRRPVRSILTALAVGVAVGSFIVLYGLSYSVEENMQQSVDERGSHLTIGRRGSAELFGSTIPQKIGPRLAEIPGVQAITGELISLAATDADNHVIAVGWPDNSFFWQNVPLQAGRLPNLGESKVVLIGNDIADALHKRLGDTIALIGEKFRIIGITRFSSLINRNAVIVPLADLQDITFRSGVVTFLYAKLADPNDPAEVKRIREIMERSGDVVVSTSETMLHNNRMLGLLRAVSSSMGWVALFMGILMVLNTLLMAVIERTREIGILSAIGWSSPRIMGAFVLEGLILTIIGSMAGAAIGVAGSHLLSAIPAIGRYVAVRPTPGLIAATALAAIALGTLGSLYPAWLATRQSPAVALDRA
ncbi:MAG: ABC transporter permease [Steroidobacteraceae bacterium]